jgi:hypothetical protein
MDKKQTVEPTGRTLFIEGRLAMNIKLGFQVEVKKLTISFQGTISIRMEYY